MQGGTFQSNWSFAVTFLVGECMIGGGGDLGAAGILLCLNWAGCKGSFWTSCILKKTKKNKEKEIKCRFFRYKNYHNFEIYLIILCDEPFGSTPTPIVGVYFTNCPALFPVMSVILF